MDEQRIANGLAWFGIALGAVELAVPDRVARIAGIERYSGFIRPFGVREIASGVLTLASGNKRPGLWARTLGDALDGAVLGANLLPANPRRARTLLAALAIAPVVALDIVAAFRRPSEPSDAMGLVVQAEADVPLPADP